MEEVTASGSAFRRIVSPRELNLEIRPPSKGGDMSQMLLMEDVLLEHRDVACSLVSSDHGPFTAERLRDGAIHENYIAKPKQEVWRYRQNVPVIESRALLYRDSFSQLLLPLLIKSFDELIVVPHGELGFNPQYFVEHNPDIVIYQFVERDLIHKPDRSALEQFQYESNQ